MQVPDVLQFALKDENIDDCLDSTCGVSTVSAHTDAARTVGDGGDGAVVETGTVVVILFASVYLLRTTVRTFRAQRVQYLLRR